MTTQVRPQLPITIRPSQCIPQHTIDANTVSTENRRVHLKHPGYPEHHNVLLTLEAPDGARDGKGGGLHHETARIACALIAGNRWDGYLARSAGGDAINLQPDDVLTETEYFFIVPAPGTPPTASPYEYPIVPSFRQWQFPQKLPESWHTFSFGASPYNIGPFTSNSSMVLQGRDGSCRMSDSQMGCDCAHICPQSEAEWFNKNAMWRYIRNLRKSGAEAVDDTNNMLLLRADLHRGFDKGDFVFVPKKRSIVVHALQPYPETRLLYHNTELLRLSVPAEFLLTRLAYSLFPMIEGFLMAGSGHKLLLLADSEEPSRVSTMDCWKYTKQAERSRPSSPRKGSPTKRPRAGIEDQDCFESSKRCKIQVEDFVYRILYESPGSLADDASIVAGEGQSLTTNLGTDVVETQGQKCNMISPEDHHDDLLVDDTRLESLRGSCLAKERMRSDPEGRWQSEQGWLKQTKNHFSGPDDIRRMWLAQGLEVQDE